MSSSSSAIRNEILELIGTNPSGHLDTEVCNALASKLQSYADCPDVTDTTDVVFTIGKTVYGVSVEATSSVEKKTNGSKPIPDNTKQEEDVPIVEFAFMRQFMKDVFLSYGCTESQADTSAEVLIEADKRGIDSHGLGRLKPIYCDRIDKGILWANKPITVLKETKATALVDGNLGLGLYVGPHCMNLAIKKAKEFGIGFVACQNSTHYGIAGYYATMATEKGCIGFTGTNARPSIAPTFGVEPMLGTNPLCFGIPTSEQFPFVIDCATSVNQRGKIEKYARSDEPTPRGAVIDHEGIERTDTHGILRDMVLGKCALTPVGGAGDAMGGYKGYGWATVVELLSTAFQSGPFGEEVCGVDRATGKAKPMPLGHFFLAIDVESICPLNTFKENAGSLLSALRESKKSPLGPGRIWTAGELENDARLARNAQGGMKVIKALQQNMIDLREKHPSLKQKYGKMPFES